MGQLLFSIQLLRKRTFESPRVLLNIQLENKYILKKSKANYVTVGWCSLTLTAALAVNPATAPARRPLPTLPPLQGQRSARTPRAATASPARAPSGAIAAAAMAGVAVARTTAALVASPSLGPAMAFRRRRPRGLQLLGARRLAPL